MIMVEKEQFRVPRGFQSGDISKEGKRREEKKDKRAGNRIGLLSSKV